MNCEEAKPRLVDYLLEEATEAERLEIRQHADGCPPCATELARLRQTVTLLARAEVPEEIPQRIRLVAEPASLWAAFWRSSARLAFASAGLACLAIGLLGIFRASISHTSAGWEIAFAPKPTAPSAPTVAFSAALDRAEAERLIAAAVAASEAKQQKDSAQLFQAVARQNEQRRTADLGELSEGFRYLQAAQTMMWKDQVESQTLVGALARQVGMPSAQP